MQFYTTRFQIGTIIALVIFILIALASQAFSQTDIAGTRTTQMVVNLVHSQPFGDADSADVITMPAGCLITAVYVRSDTATTAVDSLQLRLGASKVRVFGWIPNVEGIQGAIQTSRVDIPVESDQVLRLHRYASVDAAGQVRITIEWIPLY